MLQLMNHDARIVARPIPTYYGDETSRVNGLAYASEVVINTVANFEPKTLILSTPNSAFAIQRVALRFGQFNYGRTGILDRTHTRLFSFRTPKHLLRDAGYELCVVRGVPAPFPLVAGNRIGGALLWLNHVLIKLRKTLFSFQMFVVAKSTPDVEFLVMNARSDSDQAPR